MNQNKALKKRKTGFTLIEVLIALVILALAFSASYFTLSSTTRHLLYLQDKTAASWVGMNVLARAQLGAISSSDMNRSSTGTDTMLNTQWNWTITFTPTNDNQLLNAVVQVNKANSNQGIIQLTGYVLKKTST